MKKYILFFWIFSTAQNHIKSLELVDSLTSRISDATPVTLLTKENVINLKLSDKGVPSEIKEVDCVASMFMSPYHLPVNFSSNGSYVGSRMDKVCKWMFVGTEPCIPSLSCSQFRITGNCDEEYFEVFDGYEGIRKYCKGDKTGPQSVVASNDLRDLYITYYAKAKSNTKFQCTVRCSQRDDSDVKPLPKGYTTNINTDCFCGVKDQEHKIVGGEAATENEFPWLVALVESKTRQPFCCGSIINDRMILTAGHCFKGRYLNINDVEVLLNANILDSMTNLRISKHITKAYDSETLKMLDKGNKSERHKPEEVFIHPLYIKQTNDFDVAVIKLRRPINFGNSYTGANPICLPELGTYLRTFGNRRATVAGWGLEGINEPGTSNYLQKVNVTIYPPAKCKELYAHRVNRRMICAGDKEGRYDSCSGDSGGPLVVQGKNSIYYQAAVVSWGDGCAERNHPGVYFRTTEAAQWLHYHSSVNKAAWCMVPN